jgi:SAM-dependent methyltransferase
VLGESQAAALELEDQGTRDRIERFYGPWLERLGRPLRVLDCGCGNGLSVDILNEHGWSAWGNDLSALRRWQWRQRRRRDRLVVGDGGRLPFATGVFDVVLSSGVLEHIGVEEAGGEQYTVRPQPDQAAQRQRMVAELVRVTDPKHGRIWLDFPNGRFPIDFWHGITPGGARWHWPWERFLLSVGEVRRLVGSVAPGWRVTPLSPAGRLRFAQVGRHWYGRALALPVGAWLTAMGAPGLRWLAGSWLNPYLVLELRPGPRTS